MNPKQGYADMIIGVLSNTEEPMSGHHTAQALGIQSQGEILNIMVAAIEFMEQGILDEQEIDDGYEGTHGVRKIGYRLNILHRMAAL